MANMALSGLQPYLLGNPAEVCIDICLSAIKLVTCQDRFYELEQILS